MWDNYKYLFLLLILFGISCCNTTEPPPDEQGITLKLEDISCTEAWITLTTTNIQLPTTVTLKQNNQIRKQINLVKSDTLLYIDSLLPNTTYQYQVSSIEYRVTSNQIQLTTLDTTSHNFTFETWTFGEHSSSVLYDCAIISSDNIWCVGEIYMNDSLGQPDPNAYNAIHWDGTYWELMRIMFYTICGQQSRTPYPAKAIFAFSENDIWIGGGGRQIVKISGTTQIETHCAPFSIVINKIWGSSSNDLYVVGNDGNIAWYNGSLWSRIESGSDVDIQDIWGITSNNTTPFILCAASNAIEPGEHKILRIINSNNVDTIGWISNKRVHSIWMDSKYQLFACGDGVFKNNSTNVWIEQNELTFVFTERIRGKSKNDSFAVGHFGFLAHYNGIGWKEYPEASEALVYTSLDIKNNLIVTVGYTQTKAVIQMFNRN